MAYSARLLSALPGLLGGLILFLRVAPSAPRERVRDSLSPYGRIIKLPVTDRQDIQFVRVSPDGESFQNGIVSIAQDNYGFLWFGGHGLHRYDGYSLKSYWHDSGDPNSLSDDNVRVVFKDRTGILWIGTFGGLDRLDPATDTFTHYRHEAGNELSLSDSWVSRIYQDHRGVLWMGTNGGLDRMNPENGTFTHYRHDPQDAGSLSGNVITSILEDHTGNFWIGTSSGVNRLDRATGRCLRFVPDPADPQSLGHNYVFSMREDRSGVLWVGIGNWLSSLNAATGKFTHFSFHPEDPGRQSVEGVTSIHEDRDGVLWLGTVENGLLKLGRDRREFLRYSREPANPTGLPDNLVRTVFEDSEGVLWVGTENSVSHFFRKPPPFVNYRHEPRNPNSLADNPISSVMTDRQGVLWIAGAGRLNRLDRKTGHLTVYRHNPNDRYSLPSNPIFAIHEDRSGNIWLGTYGGGLSRFDRKAGRFLAYRHEPRQPASLSSDLVLSLLEDRQGALWVGTQDGGLNRLDPATGSFTSWRNDPRDPHSLSQNNVIAIVEDHEGFLWLGTLDGLDRFDSKTGRFLVYRHNSQDPHSLSHNKVNAVWESRDGALWIGTDNGLDRMDRRNGTFTSFNKKNGLPDNKIDSIVEDDQGDLWLATNNGLSRFHPATATARNYSESDGLPGNSIGRGCRIQSGEMLFASNNGLITFHPGRLSPNPYVPPVVLTSLSLFNKQVRAEASSPLGKPIWATGALTLTHSQSIFTLEFAALSYAAPGKNRYRYRLEGLETEWNEVDSRRRLATYTSLPAGEYVFRVQASNNDGVWNQTGATLAITMLPAWWETWWFTSVAALGLLGLACGGYRSQARNWQVGSARLEALVSDRTRELQIAKDAAEAANRAKTTFLANMSHELRTPLNAILGFSNLLQAGDISVRQRRDLGIIYRSGEHLLSLIDEVLDVARIEAGRGVLELAPCKLTALVQEVMDMMRERAQAKDLTLLLIPSPRFPRFVRADAPKLRQVLINLLGNAIKYTERGSVTLRLESAATDQAGKLLLKFYVEDTGTGIAYEDRTRIFEAFVQLARSEAHKGNGLGLTITRQFVQLMGGAIYVDSTLGEGSSFCVELPVEQAQEAEMLRRGDGERIVGLEPGEPEYRILIADDESENRTVLERLLQNAGFTVRAATDGPQAVELFRTWRPHFIWMDLRMPRLDGIEATRHIRALEGGREVKIAAVTASVFAGQRSEVLAAGLDDFVRKPFHPGDIFDCMARHLGVRYRHVGPPAAALPARPAGPGTEALAALPEDLRMELRNAVVTLDRDRILGIIGRVSEHDPDLGRILARCADRLAFTAIYAAIEGCQTNSASDCRSANPS